MNSCCLHILDALGYIPVPSKAEQIVYESVKKSFRCLFGHQTTDVILNHLSSVYGLSEKELITNYDIFETSLYKISDYAAKVVLKYIRKEVLVEALISQADSEITEEDILNPSLGIADIIKKIGYDEITKFVQTIPAGEHIVFIYEKEDTKDKLLSAFFDHDCSSSFSNTQIISRALLSSKQTKFDFISNILYYDYLLTIEKSKVIKNVSNWIKNWSISISKNSSISKKEEHNSKQIEAKLKRNKGMTSSSTARIAVEDGTWFFANNFTRELLLIEKTIKKCAKNNDNYIGFLCTYKVLNIPVRDDDHHVLRRMIKAHNFVILEDPPTLYKSTRLDYIHKVKADLHHIAYEI
jgi:hypothetical protein